MPTKFLVRRVYYFRDKYVVFTRNCKFAHLIQCNMQYIPCNSALLTQGTLFLTPKKHFHRPETSRNCVNRDISQYHDKIRLFGLKIFVWVRTFMWRPFAHSCNFSHPALNRTLRTRIPCQTLFAQWQWFSESLVSFLGSAGGAKSLGLATTSHNFFHSLNTFCWQTTPVLNEHTPRIILQKM